MVSQIKFNKILIVSIDTILQRLCPVDFIMQKTIMFEIGDVIDLKNVCLNMEYSGYYKVAQVRQHGEYSVRGSIIDLYPTKYQR